MRDVILEVVGKFIECGDLDFPQQNLAFGTGKRARDR
jgi:hypothetical protein